MSIVAESRAANKGKTGMPSCEIGSTLIFRDRVVLYCVGLFAYYVFAIWALWYSPNQYWGMYSNIDGVWAAWTAEGIIKWGYPFDLSPYNILSGMGSMFAPFLPWLNPGALSLGLPFDKGANYAISYTFYILEILASTVILMRVIGLSPLRSVMAAQIYTLVLFPPMSEWFIALPWYSLAPYNAHLVVIANLALCLFVRTGCYRFAGNVACSVGVIALFWCAMVSGSVTFLTYIPAYFAIALALMVAQRQQGQILFWKIALIATIMLTAWMVGLLDYLTATQALSARVESTAHFANGFSISNAANLWRDAWERFDICGRPQELLCRRYPIFWFHLLAMAGAIIALVKKSPELRWIATFFLIYYALVHAWELAAYVQLFGKLYVVSTPYLVWASYPLFALFVSVLIFSPYDFLRHRFALSRSVKNVDPSHGSVWLTRTWSRLQTRHFFPVAMLLTLVIPLCAYQLWKTDLRPAQPPKQSKIRNSIFGTSPTHEPVVGAITRYLIENASLTPGAPFRGYTMSYFGDPAGHMRKHLDYPAQANMGWQLHVETRGYLDTHYGNRFQEMDLWQFDIPTVEEYGQWVTKQAQVFVTQLFSSPGDSSFGVMLQLYKLDIDLLPAIGVRFIITDLELADPRVSLRAEQQSPTAGPIHLYEITGPNLATYSPVEVSKVSTFKSAMDFIRQNSRDLNRKAVVFGDLSGPFVPASQSSMLAERDGFRVIAQSTGRSLLVLPVQYSHCLKITSEQSGTERSSARLMRINGIQTLLVFDRGVDIRVRFDFGLLGNTGCRKEDAKDYQLMGIIG